VRLRPLDAAAALAAVAVIVIFALAAYSPSTGSPEVVISGDSGEWIYPLEADRSVQIPGPLGLTTVLIQNHSARVVDSPCKNKLCIAMGAISSPGQWIACLPNKVFVRIEGRSEQASVDANAY